MTTCCERLSALNQTQNQPPCVSRMSFRTLLASSGMIAAIGLGYGMWTIISPGEERRREMVKNLPEYSSQTMDETRKRTALVMQTLKEAAECNENLSRGVGGK
ncbi:hypothetical protein F7725_013396 [Dissostichus mawsoni]|uniref:Ubiquinol-cytochrome-c reductase complex assembly factor 3 n=1 Tax=Dissostichus mawsoni TaxID=36200 RepID=A0A7J5YPW8_DISMA|nr:hypothetical protein F7725_013396 [Dissostichus mawsoni]